MIREYAFEFCAKIPKMLQDCIWKNEFDTTSQSIKSKNDDLVPSFSCLVLIRLVFMIFKHIAYQKLDSSEQSLK